MYVWARLLANGAKAARGKRLEAPFGVSSLTFRAWPSDCDPNGHVNNGRFAMIADIGRFDLLYRMGIWQAMRRNGMLPVMSGGAMSFRREVRMWSRFRLSTRIATWEGTRLVCEQRFSTAATADEPPRLAALILTSSGFYGRTKGQFEPVESVLEWIGAPSTPPPPDPAVQAFLAGQDRLRQRANEDT